MASSGYDFPQCRLVPNGATSSPCSLCWVTPPKGGFSAEQQERIQKFLRDQGLPEELVAWGSNRKVSKEAWQGFAQCDRETQRIFLRYVKQCFGNCEFARLIYVRMSNRSLPRRSDLHFNHVEMGKEWAPHRTWDQILVREQCFHQNLVHVRFDPDLPVEVMVGSLSVQEFHSVIESQNFLFLVRHRLRGLGVPVDIVEVLFPDKESAPTEESLREALEKLYPVQKANVLWCALRTPGFFARSDVRVIWRLIGEDAQREFFTILGQMAYPETILDSLLKSLFFKLSEDHTDLWQEFQGIFQMIADRDSRVLESASGFCCNYVRNQIRGKLPEKDLQDRIEVMASYLQDPSRLYMVFLREKHIFPEKEDTRISIARNSFALGMGPPVAPKRFLDLYSTLRRLLLPRIPLLQILDHPDFRTCHLRHNTQPHLHLCQLPRGDYLHAIRAAWRTMGVWGAIRVAFFPLWRFLAMIFPTRQ